MALALVRLISILVKGGKTPAMRNGWIEHWERLEKILAGGEAPQNLGGRVPERVPFLPAVRHTGGQGSKSLTLPPSSRCQIVIQFSACPVSAMCCVL